MIKYILQDSAIKDYFEKQLAQQEAGMDWLEKGQIVLRYSPHGGRRIDPKEWEVNVRQALNECLAQFNLEDVHVLQEMWSDVSNIS